MQKIIPSWPSMPHFQPCIFSSTQVGMDDLNFDILIGASGFHWDITQSMYPSHKPRC